MGATNRSRQLGRTVLAIAISALGTSAIAEQKGPPPGANAPRDYLYDTERGPARTGLTGECIRTGTWSPEAVGGPCGAPAPAAAKAPEPAPAPVKATEPPPPAKAAESPPPAKAAEPAPEPAAAAATPAPQPAPPPEPDFYPEPEPSDMVPVPPMTASEEADDGLSAPLWYYDEEAAVAKDDGILSQQVNPDFDEQVAAAEAQMREEATLAAVKPAPAAPAETPKAAPAPPPPPPAAAPAPAPQARHVIKTLALDVETLFAFNKYELTAQGKQKLDAFVGELAGLDYGTIEVTGHTDRIGKPAYNMKLSRERAEAVKKYLVSKGIAPGRIAARGVGSTQPVTKSGECSNKLKRARLIDCLHPDRRVEVEVLAKKQQ